MSEIRLEGVTKRFGDVVALEDLSLTIEDGAFTSVFGPPGSGKSVLLRLLLGLDAPDAGRIFVAGRDVTGEAPAARNLAMVFQNLALFPHLTARENLVFPLVRRRTPAAEIDRKLDRLAGVLGIAHILHKKPGALSGGERQRVAIGRALIRDAAAYMMDEPVAALDARLRDTMRVELKRLQAELGHTFIYVTHDCDEAMSVADHMVILERGRIAQADRPDRVYAHPASLYVAETVGSPGINVLDGEHGSDGIASAFGNLAAAPGHGAVRMAIRPEAIRILPAAGAAMQGTVTDVERLGGFSIVTIGRDAARLRAIAEGTVPLAIGTEVGLGIDPSGLHLFGPAAGIDTA